MLQAVAELVSEKAPVLLKVHEVSVHFPVEKPHFFSRTPRQALKAVNGVSFRLYQGKTLGVVGESGCGKSTLARAIIGLIPVNAGRVLWLGEDLSKLSSLAWNQYRQAIQMIFQDPLASLNPRMAIGSISKAEVTERVQAMMAKVGLLPAVINRYPHEFSGGQCQRIGIARPDPKAETAHL